MSGADSAEPAPSPDLIERGPPGTRFGQVRRFAEIDSTNRYLLDLARRQPLDGVVAVAEHQTAGRGRLGRTWEAPPGANLLVSVLVLPGMAVERLHLCTVALSLAAVEACRASASLEPMLKWPNDLLVGERKLAGILAESVPLARPTGPHGSRRAVVLGIGLNVDWPPPDDSVAPAGDPDEVPTGDAEVVPGEIRRSATSIRRETGSSVDRDHLLDLLLVGLEGRLCQLDDEMGATRLAAEYRSLCATVGQAVRVVTAEGEVRGEALDITPDGRLVVDVGVGLATISAGDVVHVHGEL